MGDLAKPREPVARLVPHVHPGRGYSGAKGAKPEVSGN